MIKEPAYSPLEHRNASFHIRGEFLLLIFIIIFGLIGICLCLGMSVDRSPSQIGMLEENPEKIYLKTHKDIVGENQIAI